MALEDLTAAQTATATLLERFDVDDWMRDSPCRGWDVAAVVRHLVVGERHFADSLAGSPGDAEALVAEVGEVPNTDLPAAYAESAERLRSALAAADPSATYATGLGEVPPAVVERLRTVEALVHGWDAARGAGKLLEVDDALAERALEHSEAMMAQVPPDRAPFDPPVEVPPGLPAIDRLAGYLGRRVTG